MQYPKLTSEQISKLTPFPEDKTRKELGEPEEISGKVYVVVGNKSNHEFALGEALKLCNDDGSSCPRFRSTDTGEEQWVGWSDLAPYPTPNQPKKKSVLSPKLTKDMTAELARLDRLIASDTKKRDALTANVTDMRTAADGIRKLLS
ncbi:MAG: hypothetical protein WC455_10390 [Dehalococcoidia bacterium]|jgi:hypothetical protein